MKKNDNKVLKCLIGFYKKIDERCNRFINELLDDKPQSKYSLLDTLRAKFAKRKTKDEQ